MTTPTAFGIGSTQAGITALSALATPVMDPKSTFSPYSQDIRLGDGTVRGSGWATAIWSWAFLPRAARDQLRTFCPGKSAVVYIWTRTMDSSDVFGAYQAVMVWPTDSETRDFTRRTDFKIQFQRLVVLA